MQTGDRAPMTELKRQLIENSKTEYETLVANIAESLSEAKEPKAVSLAQIKHLVRREFENNTYMTDYKLAKTLRAAGLEKIQRPIPSNSGKLTVWHNSTMRERVSASDPKGCQLELRDVCKEFDQQM